MLALLLQTRLRYTLHFIRYHFDRRTIVEIGFIFIVLLFLIGRSPGDIGYDIKFITNPEFYDNWVHILSRLLPILYVIFVLLAWFTLRPTPEWQILGNLPLSNTAVVQYFLLRFAAIVVPITLLMLTPLLSGQFSFVSRLLIFLTTVLCLISIQMLGFWRASILHQKMSRIYRFIQPLYELIILVILFLFGKFLKVALCSLSVQTYAVLLISVALSLFFLGCMHQRFGPKDLEIHRQFVRKRSSYDLKSWWTRCSTAVFGISLNDITYLLRHHRSLFVVMFIESSLLILNRSVYDSLSEASVSYIFLQLFFSWILVNLSMALFERDSSAVYVVRTLPISANTVWLGRWLTVFLVLSLPIYLSVLFMLIKFGPSLKLFYFAGIVLVGLPGLVAAIFSTTGFALFPHSKLAQNIFNASLLFIVLFWFFMPLGSILILVVMLMWTGRSQKRYGHFEVT